MLCCVTVNNVTQPHPLREALAAEIRARLAAAQISKTRVADAIGHSLASVSRKMSGQAPVQVDELATIAAMLDTTPGELLTSATERTTTTTRSTR